MHLDQRWGAGQHEFNYLKKIYLELKQNSKDFEIIYLSSTPDCITHQKKWLDKYNFPEGPVMQRSCVSFKDLFLRGILKLKLNRIEKYLKANKGQIDELYFFGDNAERDPEVYKLVKNKFHDIKSSIFIRDIAVKATRVDSLLSVTTDTEIHYFLTEHDLLKFRQFSFVSKKLKDEVEQKFKLGELYPKYLVNNLTRRYRKELKFSKKDAKLLAIEKLKNYRN